MELTLKEAEKIVDNHPNLSWDGWTIEALTQDNNACLLTTGVFRNGTWHKRQLFPLKDNGKYDLPNRFVRSPRGRR